ncbi:hypothetical protein ACLOJK_029953 [Asimina triloba]
MGLISRAAFEIDDYWRIVEILHKRLANFDRKRWREAYQALLLLEHLLTHGPESTAAEFRSDREVIQELGKYQHVDEMGFNWGVSERKGCERILQLLDDGQLLKEERERARRVTRGIKGFGSFCQRSSGSIREPCFDRSNSFNSLFPSTNKSPIEDKIQKDVKFSSWGGDDQMEGRDNETGQRSIKEHAKEEDAMQESEPLLPSPCQEDMRIRLPIEEDDHPFANLKNQATMSLLSVT